MLAQRVDYLVVGDLKVEVVGDRLEDELARDRSGRLGDDALLDLLGRLVRERQKGLEVCRASLERLQELAQEAGGTLADELG